MVSPGRSFVINSTVCLLSHSIDGGWDPGLNLIWENSLQIAIVSLAVADNASSSASVVDVVTARCLTDCHRIEPLKSLNR